jgi:hypothetical protein
MNGAGNFAIVASAGGCLSSARRARVEKASFSLGTGADRNRHDPADSHTFRSVPRRALPQYDTTDAAPLWNGPRLRAPFVAQVIGQVTGSPAPDARSALTAYAGARLKARHLLFDRSV